jgi:hypothetical protein
VPTARHAPVLLIAFEACEFGTAEQADLAGDGLEDLGRRSGLRDEGRDATQGPLLLREPRGLPRLPLRPRRQLPDGDCRDEEHH